MLKDQDGKMEVRKKTVIIAFALIVSILIFGMCWNVYKENKEEQENKIAKEAYELLKEAESICDYAINDVYNAWFFGIEYAPNYSRAVFLFYLSLWFI